MKLKYRLSNSSKIALWQFFFILFGTSWLLAPVLNGRLSARTALISQYETSAQPFSWLFRLCDVVAAILFLVAVNQLRKNKSISSKLVLLLTVVAVMLLVDPIITTTCTQVARHCVETTGLKFYIHGAESILVAIIIFALSANDMIKNKSLTSTLYVIFQTIYGIMSLARIASIYHFGTLSQYVYQLLTIFWLAWFIGKLFGSSDGSSKHSKGITRRIFAAWAYVNGVLAIVLSLVHIHLFGFIHSVYFAGDTAWLAQHGVVIGVAMLYVSWHLWRGEHRARQLFLVLLFFEMLKYSVVSPSIILALFYTVSFAALFATREYFTRGSAPLSWHNRFQEVSVLVIGVIVSLGLGLGIVLKNKQYLEEAHESASEFHRVLPYGAIHHIHVRILLIHTITALLISTFYFVLWSLFRPSKEDTPKTTSEERARAQFILEQNSDSSEDYFKLWPMDKNYYWPSGNNGFIAYKTTNSAVFALADPVAESYTQRANLLDTFLKSWKTRGYRSCFLIIDEASKAMYKDAGMNIVQIGATAVIDVKKFTNETLHDKWWRWQVNRSKKASYVYEISYPPHQKALLVELKNVSGAWLSRQGHREQGFALGSYSDEYMNLCTVHYVKDKKFSIIAFANQLPIFNNQSQTTVDLMRFLPEQNNAMPFLLSQMIVGFESGGVYNKFDLGFVPLASMDSKIASIAKLVGSQRFSASGLEQFKKKFDPEWRRSYIAYDGTVADIAAIALNVEEIMKP